MKKKKPNIYQFLFFLLNQIMKQKKWYLLPIWILLATIALIVLISGTTVLIPAIYIAI